MKSEDPLGASRPVARPVTSRLQRLTNSPDRFYPENAERVNSSRIIFGPVRSLRRTRPTEPSDDFVWPSWTRVPIERLGFRLYRDNYERTTGKTFPITFGQYTGQENDDARKKMQERPPHVILTNYMMLELLLTRMQERSRRTTRSNCFSPCTTWVATSPPMAVVIRPLMSATFTP